MAKDAANPPAATAKAPDALFTPQVRLFGQVNDAFYFTFREAFDAACAGEGPIVVELTSYGGDADTGRRIAEDIRLFRERTGRRPLFFGKTIVYSAAATIMSGFEAQDRWLSRDCVVMIHCRQLNKTVELNSPLREERPVIEALLAEIEIGLKVEMDGFRDLIAGSDVGEDEIAARAATNWYLTAQEALDHRMIAGIV